MSKRRCGHQGSCAWVHTMGQHTTTHLGRGAAGTMPSHSPSLTSGGEGRCGAPPTSWGTWRKYCITKLALRGQGLPWGVGGGKWSVGTAHHGCHWETGDMGQAGPQTGGPGPRAPGEGPVQPDRVSQHVCACVCARMARTTPRTAMSPAAPLSSGDKWRGEGQEASFPNFTPGKQAVLQPQGRQ